MTNTPEHIRETLELYDRGELNPSRLLEVQALLRSDPDWQAAWRSFRSETAGIRLNRLKTNLSILESLEAELKDPEKKTAAGGDPGAVLTSSPESNQIKQAKETSLPENMEETIDRKTSEGIRYSRLYQALNGLKAEEKKTADPRQASGRILGMRRIWLGAIAAGLALMLVFAWPWIRPRTYAEKLIASGFVVPPMTELVRGGEELDSIQMIVQKAYGAYAEGDYKLALKYFESVPMQENKNFYLYYAVTLLLEGRIKESAEINKLLTTKFGTNLNIHN